MGFVICADSAGRVRYVTEANEQGQRFLRDRGEAAIFPNRETAEIVIEQLPDVCARSGVSLSVRRIFHRADE